MIIEFSVALIAFALLVGMACSITILLKTNKIVNSTKKDLHNVSEEAIDLMRKIDGLVSDIKSKVDSLDFVFRPLKLIGKGKHRGEATDTASDVVEWVGTSLTLYNKIKNAVKRREK